jgi:hypothetical protein
MQSLMPALFWHEGTWIGHYRHLSESGELIDEHESRVECIFPDDGDIAYQQNNTFLWQDGRTITQSFYGYLRKGRLWFDTLTFAGWSWQTDNGIIMLALDRKDCPGHRFIETIIMESNKDHRVRSWHWFNEGICYKRTLCNERRE